MNKTLIIIGLSVLSLGFWPFDAEAFQAVAGMVESAEEPKADARKADTEAEATTRNATNPNRFAAPTNYDDATSGLRNSSR